MTPFNLHITLCSTALFSTWIFVDEWKLLLDAGDDVSAGLLQKARKVQTVALTHPDRDHLAGLLQFLQLNGRDGLPRLLDPRDAGSFPAMAEFLSRFDAGTSDQATWRPVAPGDVVSLSKDISLHVLPCEHLHEGCA